MSEGQCPCKMSTVSRALSGSETALLDVISRAEGAEHCCALNKLAMLCQASGRFDEALLYLSDKLAAHKNSGLGSRARAQEASTLVSIGNVHRICKRYKQACECLRSALATQIELYGPNDVRVARTNNILAVIYHSMGGTSHEAAMAMHADAMRVFHEQLPYLDASSEDIPWGLFKHFKSRERSTLTTPTNRDSNRNGVSAAVATPTRHSSSKSLPHPVLSSITNESGHGNEDAGIEGGKNIDVGNGTLHTAPPPSCSPRQGSNSQSSASASPSPPPTHFTRIAPATGAWAAAASESDGSALGRGGNDLSAIGTGALGGVSNDGGNEDDESGREAANHGDLGPHNASLGMGSAAGHTLGADSTGARTEGGHARAHTTFGAGAAGVAAPGAGWTKRHTMPHHGNTSNSGRAIESGRATDVRTEAGDQDAQLSKSQPIENVAVLRKRAEGLHRRLRTGLGEALPREVESFKADVQLAAGGVVRDLGSLLASLLEDLAHTQAPANGMVGGGEDVATNRLAENGGSLRALALLGSDRHTSSLHNSKPTPGSLEGFLEKMSERVLKVWQRRWFQYDAQPPARLLYFKTREAFLNGNKPRGAILISNISKIEALAVPHQFTIALVGDGGSGNAARGRVYRLKCESQDMLRYWMEGLEALRSAATEAAPGKVF